MSVAGRARAVRTGVGTLYYTERLCAIGFRDEFGLSKVQTSEIFSPSTNPAWCGFSSQTAACHRGQISEVFVNAIALEMIGVLEVRRTSRSHAALHQQAISIDFRGCFGGPEVRCTCCLPDAFTLPSGMVFVFAESIWYNLIV